MHYHIDVITHGMAFVKLVGGVWIIKKKQTGVVRTIGGWIKDTFTLTIVRSPHQNACVLPIRRHPLNSLPSIGLTEHARDLLWLKKVWKRVLKPWLILQQIWWNDLYRYAIYYVIKYISVWGCKYHIMELIMKYVERESKSTWKVQFSWLRLYVKISEVMHDNW